MTPTALANLDHEAEDDAGEDRAGPVRAGNMRGSTTIASAATAPTTRPPRWAASETQAAQPRRPLFVGQSRPAGRDLGQQAGATAGELAWPRIGSYALGPHYL